MLHRICQCAATRPDRDAVAAKVRQGDHCPILLMNSMLQEGGMTAEYAQIAATRGIIPDLTSVWQQPEEEVWHPGELGSPPVRWHATV